VTSPDQPQERGHRKHHEHLLRLHFGDGRSLGDRVADRFVTVFGGWSYIIWQTVVIVLWMIGNTLILRSWMHMGHVPDPYPFILLNLGFSAQASYAAPLILMAQNRGARRDKDFAMHQFEVINTTHQMLDANTALTAEVHELTKAVHAAVVRNGDAPKMTRTAFRAGGPVRGIPVLAQGPGVTYLGDVSEFQPDISDSAYLAWSKAVGIRALYGDAHDDAAWYGGQRRNLLHAGGARFVAIYQYLVAGQSGVAQAQAFHRLVGPIRAGEVFVADYEEGDKSALADWYNTMIKLYGPGIHPYLWTYSGEWFGGEQGVLPVEWIAKYASTEPATAHKLWQFSQSFPVPGVGLADCSLFHGSIDELAALAYKTPGHPADWTYGPPQNLNVTPGHHDFHATWAAPAGAPSVPDHYLVWAYKGTACNQQTLVPTYPRPEQGTATSPDPGSLTPGTQYTVRVAACGPGGAHTDPGVFASTVFTTG